jgi:hypothetical protein
VEWAFYLVALLAAGRAGEAAALRNRYPTLSHPEYRHIRRVLDRLEGLQATQGDRPEPAALRATSIHPMPERDERAYLEWLDVVLQRSGQSPILTQKARRPLSGLWLRQLDWMLAKARLTGIRPNVPPSGDFHYAGHWARSVARKLLHGRTKVVALKVRQAYLNAVSRPEAGSESSVRRRLRSGWKL